MGRQAHLAPGVETYEPLVRFGGLPCFPAMPDVEQLDAPAGIADQPLESHFCTWPDAETRVLRRGEDYDVVVLAVSLGMVPLVCGELIDDRPEWHGLVENVPDDRDPGSTALVARRTSRSLGWSVPGATVSAYELPFHTWASMPQLIDVEQWPDDDRPGSIGYFCGTLDAPWPADAPPDEYVARHRAEVRANALDLVEHKLEHLLPGTFADGAFRWDLLCGRDGHSGRSAIDTQLVARQHRSFGPLCAVRAGQRCVSAAGGRKRLRQPRPRRRLDRQRPERGLHRGGHAIRSARSECRPRPVSKSPDFRHLAQLGSLRR